MVVFTEAQKEKYRQLLGEGIFRLSVGIESADDIIDDLRQALDKLP
jgi:cystathionine beta-lyase/cystathionine gamma-synthase